MLLYPTPAFQTPISDVFPVIMNLQRHPECSTRELNFVDCMDSYGFYRGQEHCRLLLEDMYECIFQGKRNTRIMHMKRERLRQERAGERAPDSGPKPPVDLY